MEGRDAIVEREWSEQSIKTRVEEEERVQGQKQKRHKTNKKKKTVDNKKCVEMCKSQVRCGMGEREEQRRTEKGNTQNQDRNKLKIPKK